MPNIIVCLQQDAPHLGPVGLIMFNPKSLPISRRVKISHAKATRIDDQVGWKTKDSGGIPWSPGILNQGTLQRSLRCEALFCGAERRSGQDTQRKQHFRDVSMA